MTLQPAFGEERLGEKAFPDIHLNKKGISPSAECGKCHIDIYSAWKNSLHSQSVGNAVFWTAYLQAYYEDADSAQKSCFSCHAPVALLNNDMRLTRDISREGVNCDFCHSVSEVHEKNNRFEYRHVFGLLKQGPLKDVESPVHKTKFNKLYSHSRFCAGCHEMATPNGIKLIETYSEWEQGPYPEKGIHCQDCHMRKIKGKIVASDVLETQEEEVSSHDIAGGHSLAMREKSLDIQISDVQQFKQALVVTVEITNKSAGHKIPTGLPSKKIILQLTVQSKTGRVLQMQQKVYQKSLVDKDGEPVTSDSDLMSGKGVKIVSDNRLSPLETRREEFMFFVPKGEGRKISATAFYSHNPEIIQATPIRIKMKEVSRWINR